MSPVIPIEIPVELFEQLLVTLCNKSKVYEKEISHFLLCTFDCIFTTIEGVNIFFSQLERRACASEVVRSIVWMWDSSEWNKLIWIRANLEVNW